MRGMPVNIRQKWEIQKDLIEVGRGWNVELTN